MRDLTTMSRAELAETLRTIPVSEWNAAVAEARRKDAYWRADLRYADLWGANLRYADLWGANLRYANLWNANLWSADLGSANLRGANLGSANLGNANLRYANLWNANLWSADLGSANLRGANLGSANLGNANLWNADLGNAKYGDKQLTATDWCDLLDLAYVGKNLRLAFKRLPDDRITGQRYKHQVKWQTGRWVECADWKDSSECGNGLHLSPTPTATRDYSGEQLVIPVAFDPADAVLLGDKIKVRRCKVLG